MPLLVDLSGNTTMKETKMSNKVNTQEAQKRLSAYAKDMGFTVKSRDTTANNVDGIEVYGECADWYVVKDVVSGFDVIVSEGKLQEVLYDCELIYNGEQLELQDMPSGMDFIMRADGINQPWNRREPR